MIAELIIFIYVVQICFYYYIYFKFFCIIIILILLNDTTFVGLHFGISNNIETVLVHPLQLNVSPLI